MSSDRANMVSVIIPAFNRGDVLPRAVESCLAHTHRPIEVVIVDDGSTDDTARIADDLKARSAGQDGVELLCVRQENRGAAAARNRGLELSSGEFVRFLDSDDYLYPDATQAQVEALRQTGLAVCYGGWRDSSVNGDAGRRREVTISAVAMPDPIADLLGNQWYPNFCYLIRRETAVRAGGWDPTYRELDDRQFILAVAYMGERFCLVDRPIGCYFHHQGSRLSTADWEAWVAAMDRIIFDGIARLDSANAWTPARQTAVAESLFEQARRCYYVGNRPRFHECIRRMLALNPTFQPPGAAYRICVRGIGYERTEALRCFCKRCLKSVGFMASGA